MTGGNVLFRLSDAAKPVPQWGLATQAGGRGADGVETRVLEQREVDRPEVRRLAAALMAELEGFAAEGPRTPGGTWWLDVHNVPVRRLLAQVARKLLQLNSHAPYAQAPGPIRPAAGEGLITTRRGSAREYRYYTITWSGLACALGAPTRRNPAYTPDLVRQERSDAVPLCGGSVEGQVCESADVVGVSWSSRHAQTLLPVLGELHRRGHRTVVLDLATEPPQRVPDEGVPVVAVPSTVLRLTGGVEGPPRSAPALAAGDRAVEVAGHRLWLGRLEYLASLVLGLSAGCTQPSWQATVAVEAWIEEQLAASRPDAVVVASDISPLGTLTVRATERTGAATFNIQHGGWLAGSISRPALLARHQVVMGDRDAALARTWVEQPAAEVHVLGQPRFDALADIDRDRQRHYLMGLFSPADRVQRVVVLASQPFGPDRLQRQVSVLLDGISMADERWGLVLAPHPAQDPTLLQSLTRGHRTPVTLADADVGARGCLAGADSLASVGSTCGLEALLLDIPILELTLPGEETLALAEHSAALACSSGQDVAAALTAVACGQARPIEAAKSAVCRWSGSSASDIADLITTSAITGRATATPDETSLPVRAGDGAASR